MIKLNTKFGQKMKKKMAEVAPEDAREMSTLQEELWASNAMQQAIFSILSCLISPAQPPLASYPILSFYPPPPYPPPHSYPGTPYPTLVTISPPMPISSPLHHVVTALHEGQHSQTSVRESFVPSLVLHPSKGPESL